MLLCCYQLSLEHPTRSTAERVGGFLFLFSFVLFDVLLLPPLLLRLLFLLLLLPLLLLRLLRRTEPRVQRVIVSVGRWEHYSWS